MMVLTFSPALNSCLVCCITSQLSHAAQRCNTFLRSCAEIWVLPVLPSIPRNSCHFAKSFKTVPKAPLTNGITTTSTWCIRYSWYCWLFQALVNSGWLVLLSGMHLSVTIVLSHTGFTWSFSITCRGLSSCHFSPHLRLDFIISSQWTLNSTLSCRFLYSFRAKLEHQFATHALSELFPLNLHKGESPVLLLLSTWRSWFSGPVFELRRSFPSKAISKILQQQFLLYPR